MRKAPRPGFWEEIMRESWLETVRVRRVDGVDDGRRSFSTHESPALVIPAGTLRGTGAELREQKGMVFFLPPVEPFPRPGDRIEYRGTLFDLCSVQLCKDIDGSTAACRCESF